MNPFQIPPELMDEASLIFSIERNNSVIGSVHGIFCGRNYPSTIQFIENTDIKNGDWIIDSITGQRYYAKDVRPIIVGGQPCDWMVKYQTEEEYNFSIRSNASTTINIHSVTGNSVIGNQQTVTMNIGSSLNDIAELISSLPASDQDEARELMDALKATSESAHPILVEGALSRFSELIKKHTDLLTALGGWAVQLLIGK